MPGADVLEILNNSETGRLVAHSVWGILRGLETFTHLLSPSGDGTNVRIVDNIYLLQYPLSEQATIDVM